MAMLNNQMVNHKKKTQIASSERSSSHPAAPNMKKEITKVIGIVRHWAKSLVSPARTPLVHQLQPWEMVV